MDACLVVDSEGRIAEVNAAAETMFDISATTMKGRRICEFLPEVGRGKCPVPALALPAGGDEISARRKDGMLFSVRVRWARVSGGEDDWFLIHLRDIGGREAAESTLRELHEALEERFRRRSGELLRMSQVFREAFDPILILDFDGGILDLNDEVERLFGWTREEMLGQSLKRFVPEERIGQLDEMLERCRRGEAVRNLEGVRLTRDGEVVPVLITMSPLSPEDGHEPAIVSIAKDLRQQKKAEAELRRSRALAEMHRDIAYMVNTSHQPEEALAYSLDKVAQSNDWVFAHAWFPDPSNDDFLVPTTEYYAATPERFREFRRITRELKVRKGEGLPGRVFASGKAEWTTEMEKSLSFRAAVARDLGIRTAVSFPLLVDQAVVGVFEFFSDAIIEADTAIESSMAAIGAQLGRVFERHQAEQALRESERKLRQVTEHLRDLVWMIDPGSLEIVFCNSAFEEIVARPRDVLGSDARVVLDWLHPRDRDRVIAAILRLEQEDTLEEEFRILRPDGTIRWLRGRGYAIRTDEGRVRRYFGMVEDITARRDAKAAHLRLEREIGRIAEKERRRIARELHDSVGSLLSAIDIKQQLLVEQMREGNLPDLDQAESVSSMIGNGIGEVRRLTRGLHPVGDDPEDLMLALKDLTVTIRTHSTLRCRFVCSGIVRIEDPKVANELYRIAQEAANNAVKHSGAEYLTISLSETENDFVLAVKDNGRGGVDGSRRSVTGGLGLQIMAYRAHAIGGALEIIPRRSKGTEVRCKVPRRTKPDPG